MGRFDGKILLELGTSVGSVDMVKYAQANGAYVIVSDYDNPSRSAAKRYADKIYKVSTDDLEGLLKVCIDNNVNAVISGVSEKIINMARLIAERLDLPTYFTADQWARFMNKDNFRRICEMYHISTPATYYIGAIDDIGDVSDYDYPVIIKPVDASSNAGISICYNSEELLNSLTHASDNSKSKKVIVEQYIDGEEISPTYVIHDHVCKMVCMGTKYPYVNESGLRALANAYVYPSPEINSYVRDEDENVKKMLVEEGLNNCTIFLQGIHKDGKCYMFEAGLRMEGTGTYRITSRMSGQNFLEFMVDNAMNVPTNYDLSKEDPFFGGKKCVFFTQIVKGGTIDRIVGYEEIKDHKMIFGSEQRRYVGDTIEPNGTLRQIIFRYLIVGDDMKSVVELIKKIQNTVKAYDAEGNNILVTDFDPDFLLKL